MKTYLSVLFVFVLSLTMMAQQGFVSFGGSQTSSKEEPVRTIQDNGLNGIDIQYEFAGAWFSNHTEEGATYQKINIPGFSYLMDVGKPSLPSHNDIIAVPVGATASIEIISYDVTEISDVLVYPALEPAADYVGAPEPEFEIDQAFYNTNTIYPEELVEINDINYYRGIPLAIVQIHPVQYNPAEKKLLVFSNIEYRVKFTPATEFFNKDEFSDHALYMFPNYVLNGSSIKAEIDQYLASFPNRAISGPSKEYILITPDAYITAADSLAQWKRQLGYSVEIVSQPTWTNTQVQYEVQQRYANWTPKPDYVVILGDHDLVPGEIISGSYGNFATDLYMVCMDGGSDYYPDMAKGRISVSSASEAMSVVMKIINYERTPPTLASYYTNAVNCAYFQESSTPGYAERRFAQTSEDIKNYVDGTLGYNVDRIYVTGSSTTPTNWNNGTYSAGEPLPSYLLKPGFAWDGDYQDITNKINSGVFYVFHRDHGYEDGWGDPAYSSTQMNSLANGNLTPIVFSINCLTGKFLETECFSEKFLRFQDGGAAGVFGHAEVSYSGWNDGLALGLVDAIWASPGLIPNFTGSGGVNNPTLSPHGSIYEMGDVANQGLIRMVETWADNEYTHQLFHYFGDPAMKMWTTQPTTVTATHSMTLDCQDSIAYIYSSSLTDGLATLVIEGELIGETQLVGGVGQIAYTPPLSGNYAWITVSKHNYQPYVAKIPIVGDCIDAKFTFNPGTTCVGGDNIVFTDQSSGTITSYLWDFGANANPNTATTAGPHTVSFNSYGWQIITLKVWGVSDSSTYIDSIYVEEYCPFYMQSGTQTIDECHGKLYDDGGLGNYSANTNYTTVISPPGAVSLNISFPVFDVEAGQTTTCNYDYIALYDGPSTASPLIGEFCNTTGNPGSFSTSGGSITVVQYTDGGVEEQGFEMIWDCVYPAVPPVAYYTVNDSNTCNATITFTDQSINGVNSWLWDFGDGNTSTLEDPVHTYASNGTYTVTLIVTNAYGSDTLEKVNYITISAPDVPVGVDAQRCGSGSLTLSATANGTVRWYDSPGATTYLDTGNTYITPVISTTTYYYIENAEPGTSIYGGETYNAPDGSIYTSAYEHYLVFDVFSNIVLKSVEVTASTSGNRTIELQNSSGTAIDSRTINIPTGTSRIDLNFDIAPGTDYRLAGPLSPDLFRNNANCSYPYDIGGLVSITESSASSSPTGYYYYFYDWEVAEYCVSGRDTVIATVDPIPVASFTHSITGMDVSFTNLSQYSDTCTWDFGDGVTSGAANPVHTYTTPGTYTATLTCTNACGTDSMSVVINVMNVGIVDDMENTITVYPNPSNGFINISFYTQANKQYNLSIHNVLGQILSNELISGTGQNIIIQKDMSSYANGVYYLRIRAEDLNLIRSFVIE